jgi:predicted flavoprotein YhiN
MSLGHTCEKLLPALVPLELHRHPLLQKAEGVRFRGQAYFENLEGLRSETVSGEFLITSYGMSGIAAMELGRAVSMAAASLPDYFLKECVIDHHNVPRSKECSRSNGGIGDLVIDFLPEFSEEELVSFFYMQGCTGLTPSDRWRLVLAGLIPAKIADALLVVSPEPLTPEAVAHMIKALSLPVTGTHGFEFAQVTAGGISTRDFDPRTLESCKIPRLFAAGEALDIDGDTGGFNLMWAFSSGILAGISAARVLQKKEGD